MDLWAAYDFAEDLVELSGFRDPALGESIAEAGENLAERLDLARIRGVVDPIH